MDKPLPFLLQSSQLWTSCLGFCQILLNVTQELIILSCLSAHHITFSLHVYRSSVSMHSSEPSRQVQVQVQPSSVMEERSKSTFSQPEWVCRQLPWWPGLHSTRDAMAGLNSCALPSLGPPGDELAPWSFGSAPRAWRFECPVRSTCIICAVTMSPSYCCCAGQVLHSTHMEFKRISSHLCEYPSVMAVCEIVSRRRSIVQCTCLLYIISSSLLEHLDLCEWTTCL